MSVKQIIAMLLGGIACALAVASASTVGPAAMPLLLLGAFPIYVAALAFGTKVAAGASIVAIVASGFFGGAQTALVIGLAFSIPASAIGHQANLAQHHEDGSVEWYPISQLFFNLCVMLCIGIAMIGFLVGYDTALLATEMNAFVAEALKQNPPPTPMTDAEIEGLSKSVVRLLPFVFSGVWLIIHVTNLYFAAMVSRASGMMPRPKDDIPATANLPKQAIFVLLISVVCASFLSGPLQLVAGVVAGIFMMAYSLLGLANLHYRARTNPAGIVFILLSYAVILFLYLPIYLFAITGVIRNVNGIQPSTPPTSGQ